MASLKQKKIPAVGTTGTQYFLYLLSAVMKVGRALYSILHRYTGPASGLILRDFVIYFVDIIPLWGAYLHFFVESGIPAGPAQAGRLQGVYIEVIILCGQHI